MLIFILTAKSVKNITASGVCFRYKEPGGADEHAQNVQFDQGL